MDRILSVVFTLSAIPQAEVTELKQQFDEAKAQNSLLENQVISNRGLLHSSR